MAISAQHPSRTIAVVARSGGRDHGAQIHGIPMLLVHGTNDIGSDMLKVWTSGRTSGALWAFAKDIDTWHDCADLRVLAIPFFDAALALRLPEKLTGDAEKCGLLPLDPAKGWLGDAGTFATHALIWKAASNTSSSTVTSRRSEPSAARPAPTTSAEDSFNGAASVTR